MSHSVVPVSPKHGFHFDGQEHDVVRVRKERPCQGGRSGRGAQNPGKYAADCTGTIRPGDIAVVTILDLFVSDSSACLPCALVVGAIVPTDRESTPCDSLLTVGLFTWRCVSTAPHELHIGHDGHGRWREWGPQGYRETEAPPTS